MSPTRSTVPGSAAALFPLGAEQRGTPRCPPRPLLQREVPLRGAAADPVPRFSEVLRLSSGGFPPFCWPRIREDPCRAAPRPLKELRWILFSGGLVRM